MRLLCIRDGAAFTFQLNRGDSISGGLHFVQPGGEVLLVGSFHHAEELLIGEIAEATSRIDDGIVLRRLSELTDLFALHRANGQRVAAHVLREKKVKTVEWPGRHDRQPALPSEAFGLMSH